MNLDQWQGRAVGAPCGASAAVTHRWGATVVSDRRVRISADLAAKYGDTKSDALAWFDADSRSVRRRPGGMASSGEAARNWMARCHGRVAGSAAHLCSAAPTECQYAQNAIRASGPPAPRRCARAGSRDQGTAHSAPSGHAVVQALRPGDLVQVGERRDTAAEILGGLDRDADGRPDVVQVGGTAGGPGHRGFRAGRPAHDGRHRRRGQAKRPGESPECRGVVVAALLLVKVIGGDYLR